MIDGNRGAGRAPSPRGRSYADCQAAVARVIADTDVDLTVAEIADAAGVGDDRAADVLAAGTAGGLFRWSGSPRRYRAAAPVERLLDWGGNGNADTWAPNIGPSLREADPPVDRRQGAMF